MVAFITPLETQEKLRLKARERRLELGFTQDGLAERAQVSVATLRKFEHTGKISLESFIKLALVLNAMDALAAIFDRGQETFHSLDDVLKPNAPPKRKKGWRT